MTTGRPQWCRDARVTAIVACWIIAFWALPITVLWVLSKLHGGTAVQLIGAVGTGALVLLLILIGTLP